MNVTCPACECAFDCPDADKCPHCEYVLTSPIARSDRAGEVSSAAQINGNPLAEAVREARLRDAQALQSIQARFLRFGAPLVAVFFFWLFGFLGWLIKGLLLVVIGIGAVLGANALRRQRRERAVASAALHARYVYVHDKSRTADRLVDGFTAMLKLGPILLGLVVVVLAGTRLFCDWQRTSKAADADSERSGDKVASEHRIAEGDNQATCMAEMPNHKQQAIPAPQVQVREEKTTRPAPIADATPKQEPPSLPTVSPAASTPPGCTKCRFTGLTNETSAVDETVRVEDGYDLVENNVQGGFSNLVPNSNGIVRMPRYRTITRTRNVMTRIFCTCELGKAKCAEARQSCEDALAKLELRRDELQEQLGPLMSSYESDRAEVEKYAGWMAHWKSIEGFSARYRVSEKKYQEALRELNAIRNRGPFAEYSEAENGISRLKERLDRISQNLAE